MDYEYRGAMIDYKSLTVRLFTGKIPWTQTK